MDAYALVPPPALTVVVFVGIVLGVQGMLLFAVFKTARDPAVGRRHAVLTAVAFGVVMVFSAGAANAGLMARPGPPPPPMVFFGLCNLTAVGLALTGPGRRFATGMVPAFWLLFQGFRLPLEVVLHQWYSAGTIPIQMTWSGQNLDVISGIAGLVLGGLWLKKPEARWAGALGHVVGLALLFNVMRIALQSIPGPMRSFDGPPLLIPFNAPFLWIVPFAVSAALFTHIVGVRALMRPAPTGRANE